MTRSALCGARILARDTVLKDHAVVVEDRRLLEIVPTAALPRAMARHELDRGVLAPGFVDVQVNGGGGVLLNDEPTVEGMAAIAEAHLRFGTTSLTPTLISDDLDVIAQALRAADDAVQAGVPGVVGIHIEGPFLNIGKKGIHDPSKFRILDSEALDLLLRPGPARRVVTLAPELAGPGVITRLVKAGVVVCAGHSLATYAQTIAALDDGLSGFTHLFNAMSQLDARAPGVVGAALADRRGCFGMIVDGEHVHPANLRIALAARGVQSAMLVTDAMPTVGATTATFKLGAYDVYADGDACRAADGQLAGSNLNMAKAFANAIWLLGVTEGEASIMASGVPAKFLSLDQEFGALQPSLQADLVHLNDDLSVQRVWQAGEVVFSRDGDYSARL